MLDAVGQRRPLREFRGPVNIGAVAASVAQQIEGRYDEEDGKTRKECAPTTRPTTKLASGSLVMHSLTAGNQSLAGDRFWPQPVRCLHGWQCRRHPCALLPSFGAAGPIRSQRLPYRSLKTATVP